MEPSESIAEARPLSPLSLTIQVSTIREMLRSLDAQTIAGRRYLMAKVVAFIDGYIEQAARCVGPRNRDMLIEQVTSLRNEADRPVPSVPVFDRRADGLLTLLMGIGGFRVRSAAPASAASALRV